MFRIYSVSPQLFEYLVQYILRSTYSRAMLYEFFNALSKIIALQFIRSKKYKWPKDYSHTGFRYAYVLEILIIL